MRETASLAVIVIVFVLFWPFMAVYDHIQIRSIVVGIVLQVVWFIFLTGAIKVLVS